MPPGEAPGGKFSMKVIGQFVAGELRTASGQRCRGRGRCRCRCIKLFEPLAGGPQVRVALGSGMSAFNGEFLRVDDGLVKLRLFLALGPHRRFEPFALIVQSA